MAVKQDDFKEKVRQSSDIVEVISEYVPLKKKGRDYWACCPFHGEKTPSFSVSKEKQFFYCYGCHVGGDVFEFVRKINNSTFPEALKLLAERANIPIPDYKQTAADKAKDAAKKELIQVNDLAARYFQACLQKTDFGRQAVSYLHQRGITDATIQAFSLGAAQPGYTALMFNLQKHGCTVPQLANAGLIRMRQGSYHDLFFQRVMIPIKNARGQVVAFGGRVLDDSTPKYLNTGETVLFQKRELLFGLDIALRPIREKHVAVVVEGYMDAISLHAANIHYAVASLGTAFSREHARLLSRIAEQVVLAYDSDAAGKRNAVRAVSILKEAEVAVKVLTVPEVKDPDEYVRRFGQEAFEKLVREAMDGTEFQIRYTIAQNNIPGLAGKVKTVSNLIPFLVEIKNEIAIAGYIRQIAQLLLIDEGLIQSEYRKFAKKVQPVRPSPFSQGRSEGPKLVTALEQAERKLLNLFIQNPELIAAFQKDVEKIGFSQEIRGGIYTRICELQDASPQMIISTLFSDEREAQKTELAAILADEFPHDSAAKVQMAVHDCLRQMCRSFLEAQYAEHSRLADSYERAGDAKFMDELRISQQLKSKIKRLYGDEKADV